MMYDAFAVIDPETPLDSDLLATTLRRSLPDSRVTVDKNTLRVQIDRYILTIHVDEGPRVLAESREIAELVGPDHPYSNRIAICTRRCVVSGEPDPDMDYFNHYLFVLHAIESLGVVYLFDPTEGTLM